MNRVCQAWHVGSCHVCASQSYEPVAGVDGDRLRVDRCRVCGFAYLSTWKQSLEESAQLYDYYEHLDESDLATRHTPENRARQVKLLEELASFSRGRKLLDVGCGDGQLLQTATDLGWEALGIDLSRAAIRLSERRGLSASATDFFDAALDGRRFDAIVMSELLEHVPSPQRFLQRAEELLESGGVLYLTTPNFGSLSRRLLGDGWSVIHPEHIGYFERQTLRRMTAAHTTLREIRIEANNFAPSTLVAWLRRRETQAASETAHAHREARREVDQRIRRAMLQNRILANSKELINRALSRAGLGDTLIAWLQKPASQI